MKKFVYVALFVLATTACQGKEWQVASLIAIGATMAIIQEAQEKSPYYDESDHIYCCVICEPGTQPCGDICISETSSCPLSDTCGCVTIK